MKILLTDDNESITKMMSKFLTRKGHDCTIANNGRNALAVMKDQKFDKVLLDLSMPEVSGFDVINTLEKEDRLKDQQIILFTASAVADEEINKLVDKEGVKTCLRKPVDLDLLLKTLES